MSVKLPSMMSNSIFALFCFSYTLKSVGTITSFKQEAYPHV